jgi:type I restriction enzyme R subunit
MLVGKYHETNCTDKNILVTINKAIDSSIKLRSKKELIANFLERVNFSTHVEDDWQSFIQEQKEKDLSALINNEQLKEKETRRFIDNSLRDGALKTTGTDIDKIMPPASRFSEGGDRADKKQNIIEKLNSFFEKYFGLF